MHQIARSEHRALADLGYGEIAGKRFDGLHRSNRSEAKVLLVGMVPMLPLLLSDMWGFERGAPWYVWAVIAASWFVFLAGTLLFVMFKSFVRSMAKKND
jgi:hypothetical protein